MATIIGLAQAGACAMARERCAVIWLMKFRDWRAVVKRAVYSFDYLPLKLV
jgi:hypothetical protein